MRRQAASGSARPLLGLLSVHQCRAADRRADPVQVETLTPQQVHRVCTADTLSALASDPHTVGADPAGLAWSALCCTVWHGSITGRTPAPLYIPYYNRAAVLTCTASGVAVVSGICGGAVLDGMPSSVAQVVYSRLVYLLYCARWNRANQR